MPAVVAPPGGVIEWRLEARNNSEALLLGVALDLPVPSPTKYLADTATATVISPDGEQSLVSATDLSFSYDGVTFAPAPLMREQVAVVDGEVVRTLVVVPPSDITHVRLHLPEFLPAFSYIITVRTEVP